MKKITSVLLKKHQACLDHMEIFTREWPSGAEITLKNCLRATELGLNIKWLVKKILTEEALARYEAETAPALARYEAKIAKMFFRYLKNI